MAFREGNRNTYKGFTLVEALISITIVITLLSFVTSFIWFTNDYTTRNMKKSELKDQMKLTLDRLEREIQQGSSILVSYTPPSSTGITDIITSNENTIAFTIPVYKKTTFEPAIKSSLDTTRNDVIFIEYTGNKTSGVKTGKILYSYIPAPALLTDTNYAPRKRILRQVISSVIVNSLDDKTYQPYSLFSYFNNVSDSATLTGNNIVTSTVVEVNVWGKLENPKYKVKENFKTRIKLRNYIK